ncbi:MAG: ABC transporter permease [Rubrivivax sp.]|nr:ABC transporter permease [Rubrivivax sp.]
MSVSTHALPAPAEPVRFGDQPIVRFGAPAALGAVLLLAWQLVCTVFEVPEFLVPSPLAIAQTLVADWSLLSNALLTTLKVTFLAFALAVVIGVAAAFVFVQSRVIEVSLFPYAIILQVTPIVAIAPLIIIWVKHPTFAMTICATIVALFPIISNTILGLRSVNPGLANLFKLNRATRWQTLARLRVPSALPYFFGGLRISSGLALIGAVVAEFVAGTGGTASGLAYQILQAGFQLNIPRLFAALALITGTGIVLFMAMAWLSKLALGGWHESEMGH